MITLNDYLFSGDTVLKILHQYSSDLKTSAIREHNPIDLAHSNFLIQIIGIQDHHRTILVENVYLADSLLMLTYGIRNQSLSAEPDH